MNLISYVHQIKFLNEKDEILTDEWERDEQIDAAEFVRPDHCVLELGGRYGVVSCIINAKLLNKGQHFVVEPDSSVINALEHNKKSHNAEFIVYNGVVSKCSCDISLAGSSTNVTCNINGHIPNITIKEIKERYNLTFTCFIADCEGCIQQFIEEFPDFFNTIDTILIEEDNKCVCDYKFVSDYFTRSGFNNVKSGFHSVWIRGDALAVNTVVASRKKFIWNRI